MAPWYSAPDCEVRIRNHRDWGGAAESLCNTVKSLGIEDIRILIGLKSGNTRSLPDIRVEICMYGLTETSRFDGFSK